MVTSNQEHKSNSQKPMIPTTIRRYINIGLKVANVCERYWNVCNVSFILVFICDFYNQKYNNILTLWKRLLPDICIYIFQAIRIMLW